MKKGDENQLIFDKASEFRSEHVTHQYGVSESPLYGSKKGLKGDPIKFQASVDTTLCKIGWREYYGDGIMEGLQFTMSNGEQSEKYGEATRYPIEKSEEWDASDPLEYIKIYSGDCYVEALEIKTKDGPAKMIGKKGARGTRGLTVTQEIKLRPEQSVIGVKIVHGSDPGDPGAIMIG